MRNCCDWLRAGPRLSWETRVIWEAVVSGQGLVVRKCVHFSDYWRGHRRTARARFCGTLAAKAGAQAESGFLTNVRHQGLIQDSLAALDAAKTAVAGKIPHEMLLLDLYNALRPLDAITGATTTDDILNLIFSTFCIGKIATHFRQRR